MLPLPSSSHQKGLGHGLTSTEVCCKRSIEATPAPSIVIHLDLHPIQLSASRNTVISLQLHPQRRFLLYSTPFYPYSSSGTIYSIPHCPFLAFLPALSPHRRLLIQFNLPFRRNLDVSTPFYLTAAVFLVPVYSCRRLTQPCIIPCLCGSLLYGSIRG